ncbi:MAG TPA: hypothetical protein VNU68_06215 [Verrucomicrobiae bacterium]|nr:hypothetical protein [Verrucomicrobiae bacterium]
MNHSVTRLTTCALLAACLTACKSINHPPPDDKLILRYQLPVLTPVEPAKQDQEKDGIRISVAPYSYTSKLTVQKEYRRAPALLILDHQYPADVRKTPAIAVTPENLRFTIKINNRLERVLRLAGTVVSFQLAGKTVAVNKAGYEDFLNGIILPRQEGEFEVAGPNLSALPDHATIALLLYDIVTATDAAGNPTQRSNFEFFYTFSRENKEQEVFVRINRVMLSQQAAQLLLQRDGGTPQWVSLPELDSAR